MHREVLISQCVVSCKYSRFDDNTLMIISQVIPLGLNTVDLLMTFSIKETECEKASRKDPQTCAFRAGFFVVRCSLTSC